MAEDYASNGIVADSGSKSSIERSTPILPAIARR
jgi:hypothetical protein